MNSAEIAAKIQSSLPQSGLEEWPTLGRNTYLVKKEALKDTLRLLKSPAYGFDVLADLTGVDYLEPVKETKVVYFLHNPQTQARVQLAISVERAGALPSIVDLWQGADWYERELYDLFGINFIGHPDLKRILMPDDWVGHPLLRDYALTEESVEFKHGVKPKVPSEIIPYVKD